MSFSRHVFLITLFGCLSWISGILIGTLWENTGLWIIFCICLVMMIWKFPRPYIIFLSILCLFGGYTWSSESLGSFREEKNILGESVGWDGFSHTIRWTVVSLLSVNEYNRRYEVLLSEIDTQKNSSSLLLIVPPNITLTPGDTVTALGKFRFPEDTAEYSGEKMLWYRGMLAEFQSFQNSKKTPERYNTTVRIQRWFDERLKALFPPPWYSILSGILLWQRSAMSPELKEHLKASGLMHLMVVSGGNIMMLIIFISLFIRSLPILVRISIIAVSIFGFTIIVGGDMPVWRAALMGTIGYTASLWWHRFPGLILPIIVATLIAFWSPLSIVYDIGLQLSFLSVICIIVWWKYLAEKLRFLWSFFAEASALTLAATAWTLPITIFYFGTFSLIGPLANMLAAPVIPLLMYSGILTLLVSSISERFAIWIGYIPWIGTNYLSYLISFFWSQKWSLLTIDITGYRWLFIALSLGILSLIIVNSQLKKKTQ